MPASLSNLQDLRTALGQLNAERPASAGPREGYTQYEPRGGDFLRRLDLEVSARQKDARVLVTGQIGVGKSSELLRFSQNQSRRRETIFCDLEKEEHPDRCGATGVFLTVLRDCWSKTLHYQSRVQRSGDRGLSELCHEILIPLIDSLKGQYTQDKRKVVFRFGGMDYPLLLEDRHRALAIILGKAAQHEAVSQPSDRFGLVPDTLVHLVNRVLRWIGGHGAGRVPLLIVDHVDKIRDVGAAEDVLVKAAPHWNRIEASIIMTAPYEHTLGDLRNSVESRWGRPLMLYPLVTPDLAGVSIPPIYLNLGKNAGLERLIRPESLRILAHYSGGILRTFVQFLVQACKEAHLAGHDQIEPSDAKDVVHVHETAYQDYGAANLELLDRIADTGAGLGEAATLLRSPIGILVGEPDRGEQRLRVHPLAQAAVERYRLKKSKAVGVR